MNRIITYLNKYYTISIFKRSIIILILFAFPWCVVFSQDKSIIPPSPQSWEFAKYIVHEVSLYNGIPEISVPLYEVKLKGITIPINLSYHASGIKLGQSDRPVGVGWVLNPGYRISRTINGYADELSQMPDDLLNTIRNLENQANLDHAYKVLKDKFLSQFVPNNPFNLGILDGEYDQFVFSTPTASGEFIISDRNNKTIHTLENSNLLFDYLVGQSICENHEGIRGFKINDQMGNIFTFGEYNQQSECIKETASAYYGGFVSTAWGLSEINTPTNEVVKFTYSFDETSSNSYHIRNLSISEADFYYCMTPMSISDPAEPGMSHWYRTFKLNEIITPNEKILFNYGEINNGKPGFIRNIEIKDLNNEIIKSIEFHYFSNYYHVFLDYITIHYRNHAEVETYRFDYYDKNPNCEFTYDHYGFYLPGSPFQSYHQEFMDDPIWVNHIDDNNCSISWGRHIYEYLPGLTCSRDPSLDFAPSNFSLKRITYPTGGYTDYFYEPGKYSDITGTKPVRNAGMRIQTIQDYDIVNQRTLKKHYVYGNNEIGYGVCDFWVENLESLFVTEKINMVRENYTGHISGVRLINYSTTMQGDMGQVFSRGFVKYPSVSEYSYSLHPGTGTKTVYQFDVGDLYDITSLPMARNPIPNEVYNSTPLYITRYRTWDKPQIKRKSFFLWDGNMYSKVKEEIFGYEMSYNTFSGLKVETSAISDDNSLTLEDYTHWSAPNSFYDYGEYSISVGIKNLNHKLVYSYFNDITLIEESTFEYKNNLLSKETIKKSTGDIYVNYTTYPLDYPSGNSFIDDMKTKWLISYPIEKVSCVENGSNRSIISGSINTYKMGGKGLLDKTYGIENQSVINLENFKFSNRNIGELPNTGQATYFAPDVTYSIKTNFDEYDDKGNPIQFHKENDINTSFIWGYEKRYPIVKVEGKTYSEIQQLLNLDNLINHNFLGKTNYTDIKTDRDYIKSQLTALLNDNSCLVTFYTYAPLVGMTSQTDPNGKTTYYEYDSFDRLLRIKDDSGQIIKEFKYHYYNQ